MGRVAGLDLVFYQVCNMDRALEFYEGVLGLPLIRREGRDWAELQLGDVVLALAGELATRPHQGGATVVIRTDDLDDLAAHLVANAVQKGPIEDMGGARSLHFNDPDGNQLLAIQPVE